MLKLNFRTFRTTYVNMSVDLVYDISCCNGSIKRCVDYIREIKDIYNLPLTLGKNVDPSGTIDIYFTSDDSEFFYKQVRTRFLDDTGNKYIYIILAHSPDRDREVKRILKNMKEKLKRKTKLSVDLEEIINRILPVGDVENISSWWPCVLQLACSKGRDGYKREIGVLFKIDDENEQQVEWMDDQFQVLEKHFRVKCRSAAEVFSEEKYIQNSACVVMYVSREQLAECRSGEENDGKEMIINKIKHTVDMCTRYNTKFLLYVEDANLETEVDLDIVGTDGLMSYWIALLNLLDIGRLIVPFIGKCNINGRLR